MSNKKDFSQGQSEALVEVLDALGIQCDSEVLPIYMAEAVRRSFYGDYKNFATSKRVHMYDIEVMEKGISKTTVQRMFPYLDAISESLGEMYVDGRVPTVQECVIEASKKLTNAWRIGENPGLSLTDQKMLRVVTIASAIFSASLEIEEHITGQELLDSLHIDAKAIAEIKRETEKMFPDENIERFVGY